MTAADPQQSTKRLTALTALADAARRGQGVTFLDVEAATASRPCTGGRTRARTSAPASAHTDAFRRRT